MSHTPGSAASGWPAGLARGAVRVSRTSRRYDETVAFYRDLVRLPVVDEFTSSYGEDGTIVGLPGTSVHLEILRDRSDHDSAVGSEELVLYLEDVAAVHVATSGLRDEGIAPDPAGHPYWQANGALSYRDPDGRSVVFAPWVFGLVPDPVDRVEEGTGGDEPVRVDSYSGSRQALRALFEEAEDSEAQLDSYIADGSVLVARVGDELVGHLQLVETEQSREIELKSMAVTSERRGNGIGTRLVEHAIASARAQGYVRMVVATAAADIDNLRFYQRRGFRFSGVERDAFDADAGYADDIVIDGIPLRDRVWFAQPL